MTAGDGRHEGVRGFLDAATTSAERQDWAEVAARAALLLESDPECAEALFVQATLAIVGQDLAAGAGLALRAMESGLNAGECADLLAVAHGMAGDFNIAVYYAKLATALPASPELRALVPPSIPSFAHVLETMSERPLLKRATRHLVAGQWREAERWFRQHLAFEPADREAHLGLGRSLLEQGVPRAAVEALRAARHLLPDDPELASLLGKALSQIGERDEAGACHRWAQSLEPHDPAIHSAPLLDALGDSAARPDDLAADFQAWGRRFGVATSASAGETVLRRAGGVLSTIGYVVGGLGASGQGQAVARILGRRNAGLYQAVGFGFGTLTDAANVPFQKCFDRWQDVEGVDPATLQAMVIAEGVDVLVDAAGFTAPRLLSAFGGRMAPCQVAWLYTPYGTGLAAMDFLLTDRFVDPDPAVASELREEPEMLAGGAVVAVPPLANRATKARTEDDQLVLAADASLGDLDGRTIEAWAHILHTLPGSVLVLKNHDFQATDNLARMIGMFGNFGLADRVDVVSEDDGAAFYACGDVALLPFASPDPQSVVDALAAGIPVICPAGRGRHARYAASVIHHLGLADRMVAADLAQYVQAAVAWAADPVERQRLRGALPSHLQQAPLFDPDRRMRELEASFEAMWRRTRLRYGVEAPSDRCSA